jgi:1-pyrroline-5-carboxylate dehydrogenase
VRAASAAAGRWARTPWPERVAVLRAAADLISGSPELAALMSLEVGRTGEALGDVEEPPTSSATTASRSNPSDGSPRPWAR